MKSYLYKIVRKDRLEDVFVENFQEISASDAVLIQIFSGADVVFFRKLCSFLHKHFPNAYIIATSTDGEIIHDTILTEETVISISLFDATTLQTHYTPLEEDSFSMGVALAKKLVVQNTKLLITFSDGIASNGEEFLNGIYSVAPDVKVAGGLAGDNAHFKQCHIGCNGDLYDNGAVGVALNSDVLVVESLYNFGWETIGIKHRITKSVANRVYEIDGMKAIDFYTKYLGTDISNDLPRMGVEFPLILKRDGIDIGRDCIAKHEDGSLTFAGNLPEDEDVYLGIGKSKKILSNGVKEIDIVSESFFIYSCMARRRFLPKLIIREIKPFASLAPTIGCFTYGEFYTFHKPELLNQTLTAVALSEQPCQKSFFPYNKDLDKELTHEDKTFIALMNVIDMTTQELKSETQRLAQAKEELRAKNNTLQLMQEMARIGSWELDLQTQKISWSKESYVIHNVNPSQQAPTLQEFIELIVPEDREKIAQLSEIWNAPYQDDKVHTVELRIQRNDGKILTLLENGKIVYEDDKAVKIIGVTLDITELRVQNAILSQQAKLAQMGEMINMIAHQWRQPLNAISAASIKLNMQSEMGLITEESIQQSSAFIEEMTQIMSQTINDFIDFTKPNTQKEKVELNFVLQDILKIMGTQLENHNIELNLDIEEGLFLVTYKKELEHVLINIISNARDALDTHRENDKKIDIKMYKDEERCIIEISDNAGGIPEDTLERIFEPYFTTKETDKGTGLGLYMSRKIAREHLDGKLYAQNIPDGAKFILSIRRCNA